MAKNQISFPSVIPLENPAIQEFRSLKGTYEDWRKRSNWMKEAGNEEAEKWCLRKAYFDCDDLHEGFFNYIKDFIASGWVKDTNQLDPRAHRKMCKFIVDDYPRKMLEASRGSQKSTIGAMGYATWRIAREHVLTGKNRLRILFASENLYIAKRNMLWVKQILEWNRKYIELAGDHRGEHADRQSWGIEAITSTFRDDPAIAEPTFSPIGIQAGRTGFHYDILIIDDLQAEGYSASEDQIEAVDRFFKLLFSMLVQDGTGEILILCTRWGNDDIYKRIEDRNEAMIAKGLSGNRFKILKMPARDKKTGSILFPTIYTESLLQEIRETQGPRIYANQYMLEAVDEDDMRLKQEYVQYWVPEMLEGKKLNIYITCDLAFTEVQKQYRASKHDYSVIMTVAIDENWNYYVLDWFRERCSKRTAMTEMYRQWDYTTEHRGRKPVAVLIQKFDRSQIAESLKHYAHSVGRYLHIEWVSYPPKQKKVARIESALVPLFEARSIYLAPNMSWFLNAEYYAFPNGKHDDALDALCNVGYISNPAIQSKKQKEETSLQKHVRRRKQEVSPNVGLENVV